ncbi:MAG TPA: lipid IV(A) 3-deoxy-D-manno-octulosonic acid transferase [Nevskiaceae bacterium]|nr:lipid IV(A) 3-deoxy-D-manno-octulosonic acid transferase [Nevskiaceae bacterium]
MRLLYLVLLHLLGPLLWLGLWWKGRRDPAYRRRVPERFGHVPAIPGGVAVWVHAVSVGEVLAALPLIRALVARHGEGQVYVTTGTPTGSERVLAALGARVHHSYAPYDLPHALRRFLDRVRPARVLVMETELWPCLFRELARRGIPLMIGNARLSPRSMGRYRRIAGFTASVTADITRVAAQSEADGARFRALGAPRVAVLGNLKFDAEPDPAQVAAGRALRARWGQAPVWIAASTHEGEERAALLAHQRLRQRHAGAVLVLVPRHPPRFAAVAAQLDASGLSWAARSAGWPAAPPAVLLGDSMGEMAHYLALADLAFVGGSLVPVGGHNVLEPAALGLPVLFGPHMHNFLPAQSILLGAGAAQTVADAEALAGAVQALFDDPARRRQQGLAAAAALAPHRGALQAHLEALAAL